MLNVIEIIVSLSSADGENIEKDIKRSMIESFKKLDEDFLNEAKKKWVLMMSHYVLIVIMLVFAGSNKKKYWMARFLHDSQVYCAVLFDIATRIYSLFLIHFP